MNIHQLLSDIASGLSILLSIAAIWHVRMVWKNNIKAAVKTVAEDVKAEVKKEIAP